MSKEEKKNILVYSFSGLIVLTLITFSGVKNHNREVQEVEITVAHEDGNYFTDQIEVMDLMTLSQSDYVVGVELSELSPKGLEERVEANPFVKDAQVYRDLKGNVKVRVEQSKPIARLISNEKDHYIDTEGNVLPINARHTARVLLIESDRTFSWGESLNESAYGKKVFDLIRFIESDKFWSAQIAQVVLLQNGEIELYPQVTKQKVVFGTPEEIEIKFQKLMTFYKEILPKKGWNSYKQVNLKFDNQIICE